MSRKRERLLADIFSESAGASIHWREIESLLHHLGAEEIGSHGASVHFRLNGREHVLHRPHHHHGSTCSRQDIRDLRQFLAAAGISPPPSR
jgi:hypothetical protein